MILSLQSSWMYQCMWSPVWDAFPGCTGHRGSQVWCPWGAFPGYTGHRGPQMWDAFPGCTGHRGPQVWLSRRPFLHTGCRIGLHSLERGIRLSAGFRASPVTGKVYTQRNVFASPWGKRALYSLRRSHFGGASSPLVTPAPCPSMQPTIKCFTTCGSACVFSQRCISPRTALFPGVSSFLPPFTRPHTFLKQRELVLPSKLIPRRVSGVNKDGAA